MISILEVLPQNDNYIFVVNINDDLLRSNGNELTHRIESIRNEEWNYYIGKNVPYESFINGKEVKR